MAEHRRAKRARVLAVAASVAAHGVVFAVLAWRLGATPELAEAPVMNVRLATLSHPKPREPHHEPPAVKADTSTRAPRPDTPVVRPADQPAVALPGDETRRGEGVRQALRGRLGCDRADLMGLTAEERERCRDRLAAGAAQAPFKLDLDRKGRFAEDPEPYLARRPHNGCKVRAAGDKTPSGEEGAAAGLACAWSF